MESFSDWEFDDDVDKLDINTYNVNVNEISNTSDSNIEKSFSSLST